MKLLASLTFLFALFFAVHANALELIMLTQGQACPPCVAFDREVGDGFDKVPLIRIQLTHKSAIEWNVEYTPTFILMDNGHEKARHVGYGTPADFYKWFNSALAKAKSK